MVAAKLRTFSCTPNKTLLALPPVAGTLTRGLARFARILAHVLAPQSLALGEQGNLLIHRFLIIFVALFLSSACTTGKLYYTETSGKRVLACDVEFVGLPSVDKFAVEYALSLCAKSSTQKGHTIDSDQQYLLTLDLKIPEAKCGEAWDHESAKAQYRTGNLSKKEYGYIVANEYACCLVKGVI